MNARSPWESLITWFARNNVAANLLMAVLLAGGLFSVFTIKKEIQPKIETNFISVNMPFLGASPEDVEEGILIKIEEAIQDIQGIKEITAIARRGSGTVQVEVMGEFEVAEVMDEVKSRVDAIPNFPDNTEKPVVSRTRFQQQVVMLTVFGDVSERTLKEFAKDVRNEVTTLQGISRAEILGGRDYEISIEVSEYTLQKYDLTLAGVADAVRRGSLDLPAGSIRSEAGDIQVRTKGQAYVGRDFENIVVRTNTDGSRILLSDIANIIDGFEDRGRFSEYHGKPAITIQVLSVGNQSELAISETIDTWVKEKQESLPEGISVAAWADISHYLRGRLDMMTKNLIMGAGLVFLTLALFLRLKLAFWVMVGLPVAFLGTFMFMPTVGVTVNMMSLFAFILVLGIVVDDAIVIGESAYTNMRAKGHSIDNIVEGVLKVAVPATFGVLTTMAAFIPILMVSGIFGEFFASIGWVVVLCLFFSIVESKLILPAHLAHMKVKHYSEDTHNVFVRFQRFFSEGLHKFSENVYQPFLNLCLNWRHTTLATFFFLLMFWVALVIGGLMRSDFFQDITADFLQVNVEMNEGTPEAQTYDALRRVQDGLWEVDRKVSEEQGVESGAVLSHILGFANTQNSGQVIAELVKDEFSIIDGPEVLRRWREEVGEIPGAKKLEFEGATGPGGGPAISLTLIGANSSEVARAGQELERRIGTYEGIFNLQNSYERGRPEIKLNIKPEAEALGLTLADLAGQVRAGFYGAEVQRVQRGQDEVKVMVRFPKNERDSVGYLDSMRIRTPDGGRVPFHAVAEVEETESPMMIRRYDRERAVRITADVDKENHDPEKILENITQKDLPEVLAQFPGVRSRLSGLSQMGQEIQMDLLKGAMLALFLIYALMAIPLRSYAQPLIIMSVIPFGIIGALFGHWVLGLPVSMASYFGIIALSGVVVNDSLILVDFINKERRQGIELRQAVLDGARARFRPILLTSLTTFLGLVPITLFEKACRPSSWCPWRLHWHSESCLRRSLRWF